MSAMMTCLNCITILVLEINWPKFWGGRKKQALFASCWCELIEEVQRNEQHVQSRILFPLYLSGYPKRKAWGGGRTCLQDCDQPVAVIS